MAGLKDGCIYDCPGCAHRMLGADESENRKMKWLKERLSSWSDKLHPILGLRGDERWRYRDRVCLSGRWFESAWKFGLIRRDELIAIPNCPVHSERVNTCIALLSSELPSGSEFPVAYYVQSGSQIVIVAKTDRLPELHWFSDDLWRKLQKNRVEGFWIHLFPSAGKRIFTKNGWYLIRGHKRSVDQNGLLYGPTAFQQLAPKLYNSALNKAEKFLSPVENDLVIDLYSGNGSTLRRWTLTGADVVGVELGSESVSCARENAPVAQVLRGRCEHRIPQLSKWVQENVSKNRRKLLYMNPPRTGLEKPVIEWIINEYKPERVAYLSCSAGTLSRDLEYIGRSGYQVESIHPYDFFPQTIHVETLVLLKSYSSTRFLR